MEKNINYAKSFKAVDKYFKEYNENKTQQDKTALKAGHYATMQAIIKLYGRYLYSKKMLFTKGSVGASYEEIPPLNTNNIRIAEHIKGSDRTVRNHIRRLIEAGLIIKKQNHGRVQNFDLWINPEIIGVKKKLDLKEIKKTISQEIINANTEEIEVEKTQKKETSKAPLRKNLPLNVSCDTETKNLVNNNNPVNDKVSLKSDNNSVSPKVETKDTKQETRESGNELANRPTEKEKNVAAKKEKDLDTYHKTLIDFFWSYALSTIYKDIDLEEHQEVIAKRHLQKYFENSKNKETSKRWYAQYCKRIAMAYTFYQNHPEYEIYQPSYYFDPVNKNGFSATRKWYLKHLDNKKRNAMNKALSLGIKKIKEAPTDIGVYASVQQNLYRFKDKKLMNRFDYKVEKIKQTQNK